jgi:hypothetical protein
MLTEDILIRSLCTFEPQLLFATMLVVPHTHVLVERFFLPK